MKTTAYLEGPLTCHVISDIYNIPHAESDKIIIIENISYGTDNKAIYSILKHKTLEH
jgi:hypothetical protein